MCCCHASANLFCSGFPLGIQCTLLHFASAVDLLRYSALVFLICGGLVLFRVQCTCTSEKIVARALYAMQFFFSFSLFCSKRHVIIRCFLTPPPPPIWSWTCLLLLTFLLSFQSVIYLYAFWLQWGVLIARDAHYNPKISLNYARMRGGVYTGKGRRLYNKDVV